ncbi:hypothetical protein CK203_064283 [Vitis vinifera]|uniref:Retrotransposon gag domain-containing protein n=1 Tax=Vitis vinifera TaxID=29760 RepID=A0A438G9T0_VITVI|nr:hypothetical protein CK203_064283 [Vitis vinifera]
MEATPEDQHSHHGHQDNPNAFRSMRDACIHLAKEYPTWTDLQAEFLKKFFPTHRTNGLKRQISNFSTKENEKFYECWERYMEAINACPHMVLIHGYCYVAEVSRGWDENKGEVGKTKSQPNAFNAKAGMYTLNEDIDMKAKVAAMTRRLEELELKKIHEVQVVAEDTSANQANVIGQFKPNKCFIRNSESKQGREIFGDQKSINAQLSQRIDSVENTLNKRMDGMQNDLSQKIDNLQYSISRLTNLNTVQEKGDFLLNLTKTPRVSMKWKLMKESLHREEEEEEEIKGKKKDSTEGKKDHDSTMNANPEKTYQGRCDEETHTSTFSSALHGKKGIRNA